MSNQAQIDALEHLVLALVASSERYGRSVEGLFDDAHSSLMSEKGPSGAEQKSDATSYLLKHLKFLATS